MNVRVLAAVAALASCAGAPRPAAAAIDKPALYRHLRKVFSAPPGVEFELRGLKPSAIPGFTEGVLEIRYKGRTQRQPIQISDDGRRYVISPAYALSPGPVPGLLSGESSGGAPAQVHVAKDASHYLLGVLHDLSQDPDRANLAKMRLDGSPSRGPAGAPLLFVEFSDLQCPFCSRAHQALERDLLKTYGSRIRWVWKYFPLANIHPWAYDGAIASACVFKLKPAAVWRFNEAIFEKQGAIKPATIKARAREAAASAGVDGAAFDACYDEKASKPLVEADMKQAAALAIDSTPTFFANGRRVAGFRDFATLKASLDEILAEKAGSR